jgi:hypothetical protein
MIPEIARVLKQDGKFITITHYQTNMQELIGITRNILEKNKLLDNNKPLPIEIIIRQFSAENGQDLLGKSFGEVISLDFKNNLVFKPQEIDFFTEYLYFKSPFFLLGTQTSMRSIINELLNELRNIADKEKVICMNKDDRIFICSKPKPAKEQI